MLVFRTAFCFFFLFLQAIVECPPGTSAYGILHVYVDRVEIEGFGGMRSQVMYYAGVCACVYVCVYERERERDKQSRCMYVCVCVCVCVCVLEREREREQVYAYVCARAQAVT